MLISETVLEYSFPLGQNGLETGLMGNKFLYMSFILRFETKHKHERSMQYVNTKTAVRAENLLSKCTDSPGVLVNLFDMIQFEMIEGILDHKSQLVSGEVTYVKSNENQNDRAIVESDPSQPFTLLILINTEFMATSYYMEVATIFTMYFLSIPKKIAMLDLLRSINGFSSFSDGSIEPNEDVLRICPLHAMRGVYGCVSRFEIQHNMYELEDSSVLDVSDNAILCPSLATSWAQQQRTTSDFYCSSITKHAQNIRSIFELDMDKRRAFVISQDIPWRQNDLERENIGAPDSSQYSQVGFSCLMLPGSKACYRSIVHRSPLWVIP